MDGVFEEGFLIILCMYLTEIYWKPVLLIHLKLFFSLFHNSINFGLSSIDGMLIFSSLSKLKFFWCIQVSCISS